MTVHLRVHVHPGARRDGLSGFRADGSLGLEVTARPERGLANQAVAALVAGALGVPRSRVEVVRGGASRAKLIAIEGIAEDEVKRRLESSMATEGAGDVE